VRLNNNDNDGDSVRQASTVQVEEEEKRKKRGVGLKKDQTLRLSKVLGEVFVEGPSRFYIAAAVREIIFGHTGTLKIGQHLEKIHTGARRRQAIFIASRVADAKLGDETTKATVRRKEGAYQASQVGD
jgi:hypothetical protein